MKVVYIAHPLSAPTIEGIEENRQSAALWAAWAAVSEGVSPSCSWVVLTGVLPESPENRSLGLACDVAQVERCDEVWLVGGRVTPGMALEAERARRRGIRVVDLTGLGPLPPPAKTLGDLVVAALRETHALP
jgi:hypothetical protein